MNFLNNFTSLIKDNFFQKEEGILADLSQATSKLQRDSILEDLVVQLFEESKNWDKIDLRQFANFHLSSYLRGGISIEGSFPLKGISFWTNIIQSIQKGEKHPIPSEILPAQLKMLGEELKIYETLLIKRNSKSKPVKKGQFFLDTIKKCLNEKGMCYVPFSHGSFSSKGGHTFPCLFEKKNGFIVAHLINKGSGAELHPQTHWTETHSKRPSRFLPIYISEEDLFGEAGLSFFTGLMLLYDSNNINASAIEIYEAFCLLGTVKSTYEIPYEDFEGKSQTSSNCGDLSIRLLIKDFLLIMKKYSKKECNRFIFNAKLCSLMRIVHDLNSLTDPDEFELIEKAYRELNVALFERVKNQPKYLSDEEIIVCHAILEKIKKEIANERKRFNHPKVLQLFSLENDASLYFELESIEKAPNELENLSIEEEVKIVTFPHCPSTEFTPVLLTDSLKEWHIYLDKLFIKLEAVKKCRSTSLLIENEMISFVLKALDSFPIPIKNKKDEWDQVPIKEIPACTHLLTEFLRRTQICFRVAVCGFTPFFIKLLTIYAIIDKLARRLPTSKLEGFSSPLFVPILGKKSPFTQFPIGQEYTKMREINRYFGKTEKRSKTAFFYDIRLDVCKAINNLGIGSILSPFEYSLTFAKQFISQEIWDNTQDKEKLLAETWLNTNGKFPPSIRDLQAISYLFYNLSKQTNHKGINDIEFNDFIVPQSLTDEGFCYFKDNKKIIKGKNVRRPWFKKIFHERSSFTFDFTPIDGKRYIPLRAAERKILTVNESFSLSSNAGITEINIETYRELKSLSSVRSLQINSTLLWMKRNHALFHLENVQKYIEECFFSPGLLQREFSFNPALIDHLRSSISEALTTFEELKEHLSIFLYFVKLGYFIETHWSEINDDKSSAESSIEKYRKVLEKKLSSKDVLYNDDRIHSYLLLTYTHLRNFNEFNLSKILTHWFIIKQNGWNIPRPISFMNIPINCLIHHIQTLIYHSNNQHLCNTLIKQLCPWNGDEACDWKGQFPEYNNGKFTIHFLQGTLSENGTINQPSLSIDYIYCDAYFNEGFFEFFDKGDISFDWKNKGYQSSSGEHRLIPQGKSFRLETKFQEKDTEEQWYSLQTYNPFKALSTTGSKKSIPFYHSAFEALWRSISHPEIFLRTTISPFPRLLARISINQNQINEIRTHPLGHHIHLQLIDFYTGDSLSPDALNLREHFKAMGLLKLIRCYTHKGQDNISLIEIPYLNLRFWGEYNNQNWILRSEQYPSFWLSSDQRLSLLPKFQGFLILTNHEDKKLVLLPNSPIKQEKTDFSAVCTFESCSYAFEYVHSPFHADEKSEDYKKRTSYFLYDWEQGRLNHDSPLANLILTELFAKLMNYKEALYYLSLSTESKDKLPSEFESRFKGWEDRSPEGLVFFLRIASHLLKQRTQLSSSFFQQRSQNPSPDFWNHVSSIFYDYLNVLNNQWGGSIPNDLKLSYKNELKLLDFIYNFKNLEWNYLLDYRLHLLKVKKATISPPTFHLRQVPSFIENYDYKNLLSLFPIDEIIEKSNLNKEEKTLLPSHFVRVESEWISDYLKENFISLFNKARCIKTTKAFDLHLFYLANSMFKNVNINSVRNNLLSLLFSLYIIRKYPNDFKNIQLEAKLDYEKLLTIIQNLASKTNLNKKSIHFSNRLFNLNIENPQSIYLKEWPNKNITQKKFSNLIVENLQNKLLTYSTQPLSAKKLLTINPYDDSSNIEKNIYKKLQAAQQSNSQTLRTIYRLNPQVDLKTIMRDQKKIYQIKNIELIQLRASIEKSANRINEDKERSCTSKDLFQNYVTRIEREAGKNPLMNLEDLVEAFLYQDISYIRNKNSYLAEDKIIKLLNELEKYLILSSSLHQLEEVNNLLVKLASSEIKEQTLIQNLGELLNEKRLYNTAEYPELLIFEYLSKKRLKPDQTHLLKWIMERIHSKNNFDSISLFAFRAGGGKTSILLNILMMAAKKAGFFPISIVPAAMYKIEKSNQAAALRKSFNHSLEVLELSLNDEISSSLWEITYNTLIEYSKQNKGLIMTPETYHTMNLHYWLSLKSGDLESVKWLSLILLDFFPNKGLVFIDEAHQTVNPLLQDNLGIGIPLSIPVPQFNLLLECKKALIGCHSEEVFLDDGRSLSTIVRLLEDKQAVTSPEDLEKCRKALAHHMIHSPLLNLNAQEKEHFLPFILNKKTGRSPLLVTIYTHDPEKADLISLLRFYLTELLSFSIGSVESTDYTQSINGKDEFEIPLHRTAPSSALFEDPYVTSILSIQGTFQRGLKYKQSMALIKKLQDYHLLEDKALSTSSQLFEEWIGDPSPHLMEINTTLMTNTIHEKLAKKSEVIGWYLEHILLPTVKYAPQHLTSTAYDLLNGFNKAIAFSATPGPPQLYSIQEKDQHHYKEDYPFIASVMNKFINDNSKIIIFENLNPKDFFEEAFKAYPQLFPACRAIIDPQGAFRKNDPQKMAHAFIHFAIEKQLPYEGILYFEKDKLFYLDALSKIKHPIMGGDVEAAFSQWGLRWNQSHVLVLFDPTHTTAANIPLPPDALALFMIAENLTLDDDVQAKLRLRQFLQKQTLLIGIPDYVASAIPTDKEKKLTPQAISAWLIKNQAKKRKNALIAAGQQQIDHLLVKKVKNQLTNALKNPQLQINIFQHHQKGIFTNYVLSPYKRFSLASEEMDIDTVFNKFAEERYRLYAFPEKWAQEKGLKQHLKQIIDNISSLLPTLPSDSQQPLAKGIRMQSTNQEIMHKQQKTQLKDYLKPIEMKLKLPSILSIKFAGNMVDISVPVQSLFNTKGLLPNLYYTEHALQTASAYNQPLGRKYLKPVDYILIVHTDNDKKQMAFILSPEEGGSILKELSCPVNMNDKQLILIDSDGNVIRKTNSDLHDLQIKSKQLIDSEWFKDIIIDVGIIQGRFYFPERLVKRINQWEDFDLFWQDIVKFHPNPKKIQRPLTGPLKEIFQHKFF